MLYLPQDFAPIDRSQIPSRSDPRDDCRRVGRILIDVHGLSIDWALHPDRRDVRRWYAIDLSGVTHKHAAWPTMLREIAAKQPQALGRRHWG